MLLDANEEMALSVQAQSELSKTEKFETGTARSRRVVTIGQRIAAVAGRDDFEWEFYTVVKDDLNAFCLPGGKIYFNTGMLDFLGQDDALVAAVMGHEVPHAIARHGAEGTSQRLLVTMGIAAAGIATAIAAEKEETALAVIAGGAALAQLGFLLPYSRLHESESDHIGTILMAKAGYDPRKAILLWEKMTQAQEGTDRIPGFLSTHPVNEDRIANLQQIMPEAMEYYRASGNTGSPGLGEAVRNLQEAARRLSDFSEGIK
ncbi:M48 family metallopeptidase [Desulfovibrio sp. OttesenSCG-928-C14]|nr:M48 family metallopeptidase [Desulfovibrio sp. OttesenSCG-928-C14]